MVQSELNVKVKIHFSTECNMGVREGGNSECIILVDPVGALNRKVMSCLHRHGSPPASLHQAQGVSQAEKWEEHRWPELSWR